MAAGVLETVGFVGLDGAQAAGLHPRQVVEARAAVVGVAAVGEVGQIAIEGRLRAGLAGRSPAFFVELGYELGAQAGVAPAGVRLHVAAAGSRGGGCLHVGPHLVLAGGHELPQAGLSFFAEAGADELHQGDFAPLDVIEQALQGDAAVAGF